MSTSDLSDLFNDAPAGPSMDMRYRQGVVLAFDQNTLANTVSVGGTVFTDLPVLGVGEATLLVPGSVVGIVSVISSKGTASWAILGRMVIPNTAEAANATALLSSQVHAASIVTQQTCNSTTYGDLATVGPTVTADVRGSGRMVVIVTSQIQWTDIDAADGGGGATTVELSGANVMTAATASNLVLATSFLSSTTTTNLVSQGMFTGVAVFQGLLPGPTTFTMKYAGYVAAEPVDFARRSLVVIAL